MACLSARLFLLSLAVAITKGDEFERSEDSSNVYVGVNHRNLENVDFQRFHFVKSITSESPLITKYTYSFQEENQADLTAEETFINQNDDTFSLENGTSIQNRFKLNVRLLFKELKTCRENHPYMTNELFKHKMYCFLVHELTGVPERNPKLGFHCNISKEVVEELKGKQQFLKIFERIFTLNPKNDLCEPFEIDALGIDNLKLNSEDEWKPKVSHMSHIYLGTSVYPIFTEESWVIEKSHSSKSLASTKSSFTKETELRTKSGMKIYQLLTPLRWNNNDKSKSRFSRSVAVTRSPKTAKSIDNFHNVYTNKSAMAVKIYPLLNFFSYPKDTSDSMTLKAGMMFPFEKPQTRDSVNKAWTFVYNSMLNIVKSMYNSTA